MPNRRQKLPRVSRHARATVGQNLRSSSMSAAGTSSVRTETHTLTTTTTTTAATT